MGWVEKLDKLDKNHGMQSQIKVFREVIDDPDNNWYQLIMKFWEDVDPEVRKVIFENFIVNATAIGGQLKRKAMEKYDCNIPWAILMDPTSACNLHCNGCWAAEYGHEMSMDFDTLDDIIKLCEKHDDCMFLAFTNGALIDEEFVADMLRVKNFVPAISVEGYEKAQKYSPTKSKIKTCSASD